MPHSNTANSPTGPAPTIATSVRSGFTRLGSGSLRRMIAQHHQLLPAQRKLGVGAASVVGKFDFVNSRSQPLDDRTHLPARQSPLRQVGHESYHIEQS